MPLPSITFSDGQGLGRQPFGKDHVSFLYFAGVEFLAISTSHDETKAIYSPSEIFLEDSYTSASGQTFTVDSAVTKGNSIEFTFQLNFYTEKKLKWTAIRNMTAIEATAEILKYIKKNELNTFYSADNTSIFVSRLAGSQTASISAIANGFTFTLGAVTPSLGDENQAQQVKYHIEEYFRINPNGKLYVGFADNLSLSTNFTTTLESFIDGIQGEARQGGVFDFYQNRTIGSAIQEINTVCTSKNNEKRPFSVLYGNAKTNAYATLTPREQASNWVSVVSFADLSNNGYRIGKSDSVTMHAVGTTLGALSLARVNQSFANPIDLFNLGKTEEFADFSIFGSSSYKNVTKAEQDVLSENGFIFIRKFDDYSGIYLSDTPTAQVETSDFAYIENRRTLDKTTRLLNTALLPLLNSQIELNADGTISDESIGTFESACNAVLENMKVQNEISDYKISIDPTQNVLVSGELKIVRQILPTATARWIKVIGGFTVKIS